MKHEKLRRILVLLGSDSDLKQCVPGLEYLEEAIKKQMVSCPEQITASIHRNTDYVLNLLRITYLQQVDVLIVGAGWANHLTGTVDAYLRNTLHDDRIVVVGVAFEGDTTERTTAAILSIEEVPGTQVVFGDACGQFVGEDGFLRACKFAVTGILPSVVVKNPKPPRRHSIHAALQLARELKSNQEEK